MTYLILFLVAAYLFKVNLVLCVGLVGAVMFFKVLESHLGHSRNGTRMIRGTMAISIVPLAHSTHK